MLIRYEYVFSTLSANCNILAGMFSMGQYREISSCVLEKLNGRGGPNDKSDDNAVTVDGC